MQATQSVIALPRLGAPWPEQGGIYAGIVRGRDGAPDHHLIIPADPAASIQEITFGGYGHKIIGAESHWDGLANTRALVESEHDHPAAQWAAELAIDGLSDFYLPARHELQLAYLNAPELFETDGWYWTSTQYSASSAWIQTFTNGSQGYGHKGGASRARAVRRLIIQ